MASPPEGVLNMVDEAPSASKHRARRISSVALIVLASLLLPIAATAGWAKRTVLDTGRFTTTVSDVALDPEVTAAIADRVTEELFALLATSTVAQELPSVLDPVRPIIVGALENRVQSAVSRVLDSDAFSTLFTLGVAQAHRAALDVLEGESLTSLQAFSVEGNTITFDLRPIMFAAFELLQEEGIIPARIDLPSADDPPGALASALGIEVPEDFGRVVVYSSENENLSDTLSAAQRALALAQQAWIGLLILALVVVAGAIALALDRRRAVFRLGLGITLVSVLLVAVSRRVANAIPENTTTVASRAIADALAETVSSSLNRVLILLVAIAVITAILARYTGAIAAWAGGHADLANVVAVALGLGVVLVLGVGGGAVLLAAAVVALGLIAVEYAKRRVAESQAPAPAV
jgi:hypothetical protein